MPLGLKPNNDGSSCPSSVWCGQLYDCILPETNIMSPKWHALAALVSAILLAEPAFPHHSFAAEYDQNKYVKLTGTVTRLEWENPHTFLYVDVIDKKTGKIINWAFELGSPANLSRRGWTKDTAK